MGNGILSGYKTYVAGIIGIIGALAAYLTGEASLADAGQLLLTAVLGMTVRAGVAAAK